MRRTPAITVAVAVLCLFAASASASAAMPRPSDRSCLIAWNAPSNRPNRVRLVAARPLGALSLLPGVVSSDTWEKGSAPIRTTADACLLTLGGRGSIRVVTGLWRSGRVLVWSFGRPVRTTAAFFRNVRLLPDGRVTKIYRR